MRASWSPNELSFSVSTIFICIACIIVKCYVPSHIKRNLLKETTELWIDCIIELVIKCTTFGVDGEKKLIFYSLRKKISWKDENSIEISLYFFSAHARELIVRECSVKYLAQVKFHNVHFSWFMTIIMIIPKQNFLSHPHRSIKFYIVFIECILHLLSLEGLIRIYNNEKIPKKSHFAISPCNDLKEKGIYWFSARNSLLIPLRLLYGGDATWSAFLQ